MFFRAQTGQYKFLLALLGLAGGHLLWADSTLSPAVAVNQPVPAHSTESRKDRATIALATPIPPKQRPISTEEVMPATMIFHTVPVGMVAHIIGTRLGRKVEVEANSTQLISGDFGHMSLLQALNEAAAKAGLAAIDEGPEGLHLIPRDGLLGKASPGSVTPVSPAAMTPTGKSADDLAAEKQREAVQQAADEKRIELLKLRAKLLLQEPGE